MAKKKEMAAIKERKQIGNFLVSRMVDDSFVLSTASGKALGIYQSNEKQSMSIAMWFSNADKEEASKILLTTLCMNLQMAHDAVVIDPEFVLSASELYKGLYARIREKIDKAGKDAGIETPSESMTEKEMLDEVETLNTIQQSEYTD